MTADRDRQTRSQLETRLARVEKALDAVSREVTAIRAELGSAPATDDRPSPLSARPQVVVTETVVVEAVVTNVSSTSAPTRITSSWPRVGDDLDLERLLGRYGMLGIAVLAAVAAVGTFLSWAISKGYLTLTPGMRVVLALVVAVGVGAWGARIRRRERPFGSSMIGLALVIVLVCAYAAGPVLNLVPTWVALAGAIATSWGLAIFAHREEDEPLWCVAFGGATAAPFATSNGKGNLYALLVYAAFMLVAASYAMSRRAWSIAWRVFYAASALLTITALGLAHNEDLRSYLAVLALPIAVGAVGVLVFAPVTRKRAAIRWQALLTVVIAFDVPHMRASNDVWTVTITLLVVAALWLIVVDRLDGVQQSSLLARNRDSDVVLDSIDAALIPLTLCFRAASTVAAPVSPAVIDGVSALLLLAFAARRPPRAARHAGVAACSILALSAIFILGLEEPTGRILALLALSLAAIGLNRVLSSISWILAAMIAALTATVYSFGALVAQTPFRFTPFTTEASLTALVITAFLALVALLHRSIARTMTADNVLENDVTIAVNASRAGLWVWAFIWGYIELSKAYSRSTSTLLLVIYFAATAIAAVAVGHLRASPRIRQLGLALALLAAITAVVGATNYFDIGARVLAYLVTSAFLLGIAYWYRRPGASASAETG